MAKGIRITAKRDGFHRAGIKHSSRPVDHYVEDLTEKQLKQLRGEPLLVVQEDIELPDREKPKDGKTAK